MAAAVSTLSGCKAALNHMNYDGGASDLEGSLGSGGALGNGGQVGSGGATGSGGEPAADAGAAAGRGTGIGGGIGASAGMTSSGGIAPGTGGAAGKDAGVDAPLDIVSANGGMTGTCTSTCTLGAAATCATSTSLEGCIAAANGCNVKNTAACGGRLVCERLGSPVCADPWWVQWPLPPSTGPTGYTDNGDGTVTDGVTGLMWDKTGTAATMSQTAAVTYCATMVTTGGHNDWRLPAKIELLSIVDYGTWGPSINPIFTAFTAGSSTAYWSSTPYAADSSKGWGVTFSSGVAFQNAVTTAYNVRCVR